MVSIEPAAMVDRQVIAWDKDDIDALKFMKVDCLALGRLTCMKRVRLLADSIAIEVDLATIRGGSSTDLRDDPTGGHARDLPDQEPRAQMSMLPRMKPRAFYDLVIAVAIVRARPTQGR